MGAVDLASGHIVPYFVAGGDLDHDGLRAADDLDDAWTVYEVNYLSNDARQFQRSFNGAGGLWYQKTRIRRNIVGAGTPIHVSARTVYGDSPIRTAGAGQIPVPHMFFQYGVESAIPLDRTIGVGSPMSHCPGCRPGGHHRQEMTDVAEPVLGVSTRS